MGVPTLSARERKLIAMTRNDENPPPIARLIIRIGCSIY